MIYFIIYLILGIFTSFYMINFYKNKLNDPISIKHLKLAVVGPFIWPLQIIKHVLDIKNHFFN